MATTRRVCLTWLAGCGLPWPAATADPAPPALMLARVAPADIDPAGYLVSEKLDGVRAVWDGRRLRFRSGTTVAAPGWFLARLPASPLDGELWFGRGRFDALSGTVRRQRPDDASWRDLSYAVFDQPGTLGPFAARAARLRSLVAELAWPQLLALDQTAEVDRAALRRRLATVMQAGGEGLMLHRADAPWVAGRSDALLKLKPLEDGEAIVTAHLAGRGRHQGRLGALRVRAEDGIEFELGTGFSDAQRDAPPALGSWVTYTFLGRTSNGVPRFASFLRLRDEP